MNISFQEIMNIVQNNELPLLTNNLKRVIRNSSLITFALLVYNSVELILEVIGLYNTLNNNMSKENRLTLAYFFMKLFSNALLFYALMELKYFINDC